MVVSEPDSHHARQVEPRFAARLPAAQQEVVDGLRVQLRDLIERGPHDGRCQVVRAHVSKASFEGAPDG